MHSHETHNCKLSRKRRVPCMKSSHKVTLLVAVKFLKFSVCRRKDMCDVFWDVIVAEYLQILYVEGGDSYVAC